MAAHIGSVTFRFPLKWINKNQVVIVGSVTRTRSGDQVRVYGASVSQDSKDAICEFEWIPRADIDTLRYYQQTGETYTADLEDTGDTISVKFHPTKGVEEETVEHEVWGKNIVHAYMQNELGVSYPQDIYKGRLNLIIVS